MLFPILSNYIESEKRMKSTSSLVNLAGKVPSPSCRSIPILQRKHLHPEPALPKNQGVLPQKSIIHNQPIYPRVFHRPWVASPWGLLKFHASHSSTLTFSWRKRKSKTEFTSWRKKSSRKRRNWKMPNTAAKKPEIKLKNKWISTWKPIKNMKSLMSR